LVSNDIDTPHVESILAINPRNQKNLLGAVTTFARTNGALSVKTWTSFDGGQSWIDARLPGAAGQYSGDPEVAFGATGTAYAMALPNDDMQLFRSTDGGLSWKQPVKLGSYDHEQIAVDLTRGPRRGRIYVTAEGRRLDLFRSDDDGRSFTKPESVATRRLGKGNPFDRGGVGANGLEVLGDGTLVVGVGRYSSNVLHHRFSTITSSDGGNTFGREHVIADPVLGEFPRHCSPQGLDALGGDLTRSGSWPMLTADHTSGRYRDRVYAMWGDCRTGPTRLYLSYSADRAKTWSKPLQIGFDQDARDADYQSAIAVNDRGVLGILYYHTKGDDRSHFDVYFTGSLDGGKTMLAPVRVSTQTSAPRSPGNLRPFALPATGGDAPSVDLFSAWLLYTADAADELEGVDLGGRRMIKKKICRQ